MINEPTLEHYFYYLRRVEGDNRRAVQERRAAFEKALKALLARLEHLSGQPIPRWEWPQESEDRHVSQRIVRTDWLDHPETGRSCFAAARTYGDVYWLQVGYCQSGRAGPEIFASLRDGAWQPAVTGHLLGSSAYMCGIVADETDQVATQALAAYIGDTPDTTASTHVVSGRARLYGAYEPPHVVALLCPDVECEDWAGRVFLNDVALRLELYRHKAERQLAWCERNYPILSEQERWLRDLLEEANRASLANLGLLRQLVRLYRVFNGNVGMLVDRQTTIGTNLDNLDIVIADLGPLTEDHLLGPMRDHLRRRQTQLEADLTFADQLRQRADAAIHACRTQLGLDRLISLQAEPGGAAVIEQTGWPGTPPPVESEIDAVTPHLKPSQPVTYPQVNAPPHIPLTATDKTLLQHVYRGFGQVWVEKQFGGGYGSARVLLTRPVTTGDLPAARRVTKLGPASELRRERDNYARYVGDFLPFSAARVEGERYYEQSDQAGLNYIFVGGGALGQAVDLEEYYDRLASAGDVEPIAQTLNLLLDRELGQIWYGKSTPLFCFFAAEYSRHMVEHLRLRLRPASSDALWPAGRSLDAVPDYQSIEIDAIPRQHETIQPGTLLSVEGMVVRRIKHGEVKLEDPGGQGIVVRVQFAPGGNAAQGLETGSRAGVRGEVVYNRLGRMEQIIRDAFPDLSPEIIGESIELPGVPGTYPNPLRVYPQVLSRALEARRSYVHGDLHLRNVLVDEWGKGWLIDFARVEKRHNLFDFIKLETYVRLMELGRDEVASAFSLGDYVQLEQVLADATLGIEGGVTCPDNSHLQAAHQVILAIRQIARKHMGREPDFRNEYFPALFLYCLAVMKYCQKDKPAPTRLAFATACVLILYILGVEDQARPTSQPPEREGEPSGPEPCLGAGNRWAVLVGVDEYEDQANYGRLHVCVKDVEAIREQLVAGGFDPARVRLVTDHTKDELPTRANILTALKSVADATGQGDLLLFYYSGHGDETDGESYLVARDGRQLVLDDTAVLISRVKEIMGEAPARAKVIILDACHSGADIGGKGPKPMSAEFIRRVFEEAEGLAILASCKQGQLSYEWRTRERSVFTHFLLEALTGEADREEKGFVTVEDANRHVTDGVKLWASQNNVGQTPTLQSAVAGDMVLVRYS